MARVFFYTVNSKEVGSFTFGVNFYELKENFLIPIDIANDYFIYPDGYFYYLNLF